MATIRFREIGIIRTPFKEPAGMPVQPKAGRGIKGVIEVYPEFSEGLSDLEGFSHIVLVFHLHRPKEQKKTLFQRFFTRNKPYKLKIVPFLDTVERGVFATRAPKRPNQIGISTVRLERVEGNKVYFQDCDIIDGTPLLDIKPYFPEIVEGDQMSFGWSEKTIENIDKVRSDERFG
jgi:tRNA-Thr(GGU) m(6)t(6)A37 methyltransferase TsaA